jgi:NitT/TauT family transport system substrate-binding protein
LLKGLGMKFTIQDNRFAFRQVLCALVVLTASLFACSEAPKPAAGGPGSAPPPPPVATQTLRLGFFPNITHAPALVAVEKGLFENALGPNVKVEFKTFNAGPAAVEALFSGALDVTYIGPNPAINAYVKSKGDAVRVIAGACSGGAAFVVRPEIQSPADLRGKVVASPQLGGTQDVAVRTWLKAQGFAVALQGGDVSVLPQENAQTLEAFRLGTIAGAWVPEPWASRLVGEGGGRVLVDEKSLWCDGRFVTTHILARRAWLDANPDTARRLIEAHLDALDLIAKDPADARAALNARLATLTGKPLPDALLSSAWAGLEFTADPLATTLARSAEHALAVDLLKPFDTPLSGLYALAPLNAALTTRGRPPVAGLP